MIGKSDALYKSDERMQAQAEVLPVEAQAGQPAFSTLFKPSRAGYAGAMVPRCQGRAIAVDVGCRGDVEPIEASHISCGLFTTSWAEGRPAESTKLCSLHQPSPKPPHTGAFAPPTVFSVLTLYPFRKAVPLQGQRHLTT